MLLSSYRRLPSDVQTLIRSFASSGNPLYHPRNTWVYDVHLCWHGTFMTHRVLLDAALTAKRVMSVLRVMAVRDAHMWTCTHWRSVYASPSISAGGTLLALAARQSARRPTAAWAVLRFAVKQGKQPTDAGCTLPRWVLAAATPTWRAAYGAWCAGDARRLTEVLAHQDPRQLPAACWAPHLQHWEACAAALTKTCRAVPPPDMWLAWVRHEDALGWIRPRAAERQQRWVLRRYQDPVLVLPLVDPSTAHHDTSLGVVYAAQFGCLPPSAVYKGESSTGRVNLLTAALFQKSCPAPAGFDLVADLLGSALARSLLQQPGPGGWPTYMALLPWLLGVPGLSPGPCARWQQLTPYLTHLVPAVGLTRLPASATAAVVAPWAQAWSVLCPPVRVAGVPTVLHAWVRVPATRADWPWVQWHLQALLWVRDNWVTAVTEARGVATGQQLRARLQLDLEAHLWAPDATGNTVWHHVASLLPCGALLRELVQLAPAASVCTALKQPNNDGHSVWQQLTLDLMADTTDTASIMKVIHELLPILACARELHVLPWGDAHGSPLAWPLECLEGQSLFGWMFQWLWSYWHDEAAVILEHADGEFPDRGASARGAVAEVVPMDSIEAVDMAGAAADTLNRMPVGQVAHLLLTPAYGFSQVQVPTVCVNRGTEGGETERDTDGVDVAELQAAEQGRRLTVFECLCGAGHTGGLSCPGCFLACLDMADMFWPHVVTTERGLLSTLQVNAWDRFCSTHHPAILQRAHELRSGRLLEGLQALVLYGAGVQMYTAAALQRSHALGNGETSWAQFVKAVTKTCTESFLVQ